MRNGMYLMNPMPGGSQKSYLYSDGLGSDRTDGRIANPNHYLVVPANYTERQARDFAARITDTWGNAGLYQALMDMAEAFLQGGSHDLRGADV